MSTQPDSDTARITAYLAAIAPVQRHMLEEIRSLVHQFAPTAVESFSYGMPGFKYHGAYLAGYGAFKDHMSFFPTAEPIARMREQLRDYKLSRGTIQFTAEHPLPDKLIVRLLTIRIAAIDKP